MAMIVDPDIVRHPKFLMLEAEVGEPALKCLVKLWAHCQERLHSAVLGKVDARYVETVCGWRGEFGALFKALTETRVPGRHAWIDRRRGSLVVHGWADVNKGLRSARINGALGGRPRKPKHNPRVNPTVKQNETHGLTQVSKKLTDGGLGSDRIGEERIGSDRREREKDSRSPPAGPPTRDEWHAYASMHGLPEWKAELEYLNQERRCWRGIGHWHRHCDYVRALWEADGRPSGPPGSPAGAQKKGPETHFQKVTRMRALEALLKDHPGRPEGAYGEPSDQDKDDFAKKEAEFRALRAELAEKPTEKTV